ncbi:UDP-glucose/GDP-mannose dehydrogenase [Candidatus Koribacter versatilis Ellin345]|uniref:UDP-glucose 6-dehydrogenase n=1 Tax=Koribacter versatilis (strain Ellin345) TaxID=204669 RepID=Q1IUZ3_KORVE|nr:nucleotide sugar dehydrogenase [Candidatus Koribacter versatilis]ABF39307.1 UDP-glucose/GDP-mannose dehydrogenase [Candidatus Koribacter versatilis Ellin345]
MNVGVYGSGYLGTVVSACLADLGMPVTCYDADTTLVMDSAQGTLRFHEKNLKEIVRRNVRADRLMYTTELESVARRAGAIFIAEDTPDEIEHIVPELAAVAQPHAVFVIVTPTPVGTTRRIETELRMRSYKQHVVVQPMFLTDGCAVEDFNWPDRLVLGTTSHDAVDVMKQIYRPIVMRGVPLIVTSYETAELVREASTAFVATKLSFINELASLCDHVKADATDLALAMGLDKKIGPRCLQPGARIGGAFVENEMNALASLAEEFGVSLKVLTAAREVNHDFSDQVMEKLTSLMPSVVGREVGILGLAFKPNTNCVAGSVSLSLARGLISRGARVRAYDPVAIPEAQRELNDVVHFCQTAYEAAEGSDALVVGTGWPEFRALDWQRVKKLLKTPVVFDTKNMLDAGRLRNMGFRYLGIGRS